MCSKLQTQALAMSRRDIREGYSQAAVRLSGTEMTLTELSALPETRRLADGLNRKVVGGNSCVLSIVKSGCEVSL